ncbi:hypothetical protein GCM10009655_18610 [Rhodoglobus aureus]|uniref:Uncharacterized protein n=1 Tax=Rhodoglobus aureus TaxID=191497 RepID=A0ABN1VPX9_9MICO
MEKFEPIQPLIGNVIEQCRRSPIGQHAAFTILIDQDDDGSGGLLALNAHVDALRLQILNQRVTEVVGADAADEPRRA